MRKFILSTDWWTDCDDVVALRLLALIGDEEMTGYSVVRGKASVDSETGANYFDTDSNGLHSYVVKEKDNLFYADAVNQKIMS